MDKMKPESVSKNKQTAFVKSSIVDESTADTLSSFDTGVIIFNRDLHIIHSTPNIKDILTLGGTLDSILSKNTESPMSEYWSEILKKIFEKDHTEKFNSVRCTAHGRIQYLELTCIPLTAFEAAALILQPAGSHGQQDYRQAHAERLVAVGKVAGRVAHELNNPLDGILRYINLTLRILEPEQNPKAVEYLNNCRNGLRRMVQILSELLEFSRSTHVAFEQAPLDRLLEDALHTLEPSLADIQVQLHRHYIGPAQQIRSDSLFQVFCNLIKNAADAMNGKGNLTIHLKKTSDQWIISFQDTGPGFPAEHADHLFEPFFTTKPYGHGTGLGLSICRDILERFGGCITAQNAPEGGSIFTVCLPHTQTGMERKEAYV